MTTPPPDIVERLKAQGDYSPGYQQSQTECALFNEAAAEIARLREWKQDQQQALISAGVLMSEIFPLRELGDGLNDSLAIIRDKVNELRGQVRVLREACEDIHGDCEQLARADGIEKGEKRAWKAVANKARAATDAAAALEDK